VGIAADITTNYATSPEGLQNATRLRLDLNGGTTATDRSRIKGDFGIGSSGSQAHSIYVKSNDGVTQNITFRSLGTLTNHEITSDWKRIDLVSTDNSLYFEFGIYGNTSYNDTADLLIWGAQIEEGSYPTSYIPNHSGGSVTRNADVCEGAGTSSTFNDDEGVLYVELSYLQDGRLAIKNSDSSDQIVIGTSSGNVFYRVKENNTNIITEFTGVSGSVNKKIALRYKSRDTSIFIDGVEYNVNTSNYTLSGLNEFLFVSEGGSNTTYGNVKQVLVFGTALPDNQCIALTS
jgi:hypothetical protein